MRRHPYLHPWCLLRWQQLASRTRYRMLSSAAVQDIMPDVPSPLSRLEQDLSEPSQTPQIRKYAVSLFKRVPSGPVRAKVANLSSGFKITRVPSGSATGKQISFCRATSSPVSLGPIAAKPVSSDHINIMRDPSEPDWAKFEELWEPTRDGFDNATVPDLSVQASPPDGSDATTPTASGGRFKRDLDFSNGVLQRELSYLKSSCPPEDLPRELKAFRKWKKNIGTWYCNRVQSRKPSNNFEIGLLKKLLSHQNTTSMKASWDSIHWEIRRRRWPQIICSVLQSHPDRFRDVFAATFDATLVPYYMVRDVLHYYSRRLPKFHPRADYHPFAEDIMCLLTQVLETSPRGYLRLRQRRIAKLIPTLSSDQAASFYRLLVAYGHPLHPNTLLHFASVLAKNSSHKKLSMEILQALLGSGDLDINSPRGASLCTSILSAPSEDGEDDPASSPQDIFSQLVACGLKPNIITYSAVLRNLCLAGQLDTAWAVFDILRKRQVRLDGYVYSTLLNASKLWKNTSSLQRVVEEVVLDESVHGNHIIWTDLLHAIFLSGDKSGERHGDVYGDGHGDEVAASKPKTAQTFLLLVQAYEKLFPMDLLKVLLPDVEHQMMPSEEQKAAFAASKEQSIFIPMIQRLPHLSKTKPIDPSTAVLSIMLTGYMQAVSQPYEIIAFYERFRKLLAENHPIATRMVRIEGDLVYNIVIHALSAWPGMLRVALDVVYDMLKEATAAAANAAAANAAAADAASSSSSPSSLLSRSPLTRIVVKRKDIRERIAPTVYTWSIILNAFMMQRQPKHGETVLQMMRRRGIEPSLVTWNALAAGYAKMQDIRRTVSSLQRLERAGFKADLFTFKAFGYLRDKAGALNRMEAMIEMSKRKQQQEEGLANLQGLKEEVHNLAQEVEGTSLNEHSPMPDVNMDI